MNWNSIRQIDSTQRQDLERRVTNLASHDRDHHVDRGYRGLGSVVDGNHGQRKVDQFSFGELTPDALIYIVGDVVL